MESEGKTGQPGRPVTGPTDTQSIRAQGLGIRALSPAEAQAALQEFRKLCLTPGDHGAELDRLSALLRETGYRSESTQVINEALGASDPNPHVGALWVRRIVTSKTWDRSYPDGMDRLCKRGDIGHRAVIEFLEVVSRKRRPVLILRALRHHGDWLRAHPRGWTVMARALANAGCYRQAASWTRDWQSRPETELGTLHARARALRALGKISALLPVLEAAVARDGPALEKAEVMLWLATEHALAGRAEESDKLLAGLKPVGWSEDSVCLYYLTRGMVRVQEAEKSELAEEFDAAYSRIRDRFRRQRVYRCNWPLRRDYRRCVGRLARDAGKIGLAIAAPWRSADSYALLLLLLVPLFWPLLPIYLYRFFSRPQTEPNPLAFP